jgi:small subunit ribosomal protein S9
MIKAKTTAKTVKPKVKSVAPLAHGVGRRKSSVARVWLRAGKGAIVVNGKDFKEYFDTEITRLRASTPFRVIPVESQFDVEANVNGGGICSQADAIKLGISRALVSIDEGLRLALRQHDLLTVDSRVKERKKYGQKAARRKFQFVKR